MPNLGGVTRWLAMPQGARAEVVILESRSEVYHDVLVAPAPKIPREDEDAPLRYEKDHKIYHNNANWPSSPVIVGQKTEMRGVDAVLLTVIPFQYNPITKDLTVYKDIRFRINFAGGNGLFGTDRLRSRFWEPILQGNLLNYNSLPVIDYYATQRVNARDGWEYVIIVPDDPVFIAWADTIKRWRQLQGISTKVTTLAEIGGNDATLIENYLNNAYNTWDPAPAAFLLLSDYQTSGKAYGITSPVWNSYCVSDDIYADVNGDNLPDMHHGRICAQNNTQLSVMINKFLSYERDPYNVPNFYDNPLVAGTWQDDRWFQLCNEVVRGFYVHGLGKNPAHQYLSGNINAGRPWSTWQGTRPVVQYWYDLGWLEDTLNPYDSLFWNNGSTAGMINAINAGAFVAQYRGHTYGGGWGPPNLGMNELDLLTNTFYPYVYSSVSLTGEYNDPNLVFAEKFHRLWHGCSGINAPSEVTFSFVNDVYQWGMLDGLWSQFDPGYPIFTMTGHDNLRPCQAMTHGKYYLQSSWMPDSANAGAYRSYTDHLFHHHGDCFATLYSEMPESLSVNHPPVLVAGATYFTVEANDSSIIALTVNGEIIGVAEGTGAPLNVPIQPQIPGTIVIVTVTKANYYRYTKDVYVVGGPEGIVAGARIISDSIGGNGNGQVEPGETIDYGVYAKNLGFAQACSVYGLFSTSDSYAVISVDSSWYGDIPPSDSSLSDPFYQFAVAPDCPDNHMITFLLAFHDTITTYNSYLPVIVRAPVLVFAGDTVTVVGGNNNGILDPGERADLIVTIKNEGGAAAESTSATLMESSPYVTIDSSHGYLGTILPGDSANCSFTVTAWVGTPCGTVVQFHMEVIAGTYVDTLDFNLIIGRIDYYVWNPDPTPASGQNINDILWDLGYYGYYGITLTPDLNTFGRLFVCCGVYPDNYVILNNSPEALAIENYLLNQMGQVYIEGSDVWYYDPLHNNGYDFGPLFAILPYSDGGSITSISGIPGTFTEGMGFGYSGGNNSLDKIAPTQTGFLIFKTETDDSISVANDSFSFRTVGASFELGLLNDGSPPSTRSALLDSIMNFFGCFLTGIRKDDLTSVASKPGIKIAPNPFRDRVSIVLRAGSTGTAKLRSKPLTFSLGIYDATGRLVRSFPLSIRNSLLATSIEWSGDDDSGRKLPAGIYFIRFETGRYQQIEKAILLR
jgi:hypothetical protein